MKVKDILLFSLIILISCCDKREDFNLTKVVLSTTGDTTELYRFYDNQKIKEVVYYENNVPDTSFAFTLGGDTLTWPQLLLDSDSSHLFAFIPPQSFNQTEVYIFAYEKSPTDTLFQGQIIDGESINLTFTNHSKKLIGALYTHDIKTGSVNVFPFRLRWDGLEFSTEE